MAILFLDLDNTLIDRAAGFHVWAQRFLASVGRLSDEEMDWLIAEDEDGLAPKHQFFDHVRTRYGSREKVDELIDDFPSTLPGLIPRPSEQTLDALSAARDAGFDLCIVTNGGRTMQEAKIVASGLAEMVDHWCISDVVGVAKPDPEILRRAAELCDQDLTPDCWVIGDRPETDILCASRAGVNSVWIDHGHSWDRSLSYAPTATAAAVSEAILHVLGELDIRGVE
jgi:FMN phosphatase YigB (HAD superfamily)